MSAYVVKVPATSANLGLGFDSMGLALKKYLSLETVPSQAWVFSYEQDDLMQLPTDASNLVAQIAIQTAEKYGQPMPPLAVTMRSEIPLTHGLGSSSSAIVAGIELANHYCQLNMSDPEKVALASAFEGHPDNVGPCITGGVFVGTYDQGQVDYEVFDLSDLGIILTIPPYQVPTQEARAVLPTAYQKATAIRQNASNNVMVLALAKKDYQKAGRLMMADAYHEPYRQALIPEFVAVKDRAIQAGAFATLISGAGPTILTLCSPDRSSHILSELQVAFPHCQHEISNIHSTNER